MTCIFCKIAVQKIPKEFLYEDEDIMVFPDISPVKPIHLLFVPKKHMKDFMELDNDAILAKIRKVLQEMVKKNKLEEAGFRIVINGGGAQGIDHLHFHLIGPMGHNIPV